MKWFGNLLPYLLATAAVIFIFNLSGSKSENQSADRSSVISHQSLGNSTKQLANSSADDRSTNSTTTKNEPKRLTINVKVAEPSDLKIKEDQQIKEGDTIADRTRERLRLNSQKSSLNLSLQRLQAMTINAPTPPQSVPTVQSLPPVNYLEQEAAVEQSKQLIASVPYPYSIPSIESCLLLFLRVVFPRCLGVVVCSRSARIRSSNTAAGSSLGSWGTSSPRKALARIDRFILTYSVANLEK